MPHWLGGFVRIAIATTLIRIADVPVCYVFLNKHTGNILRYQSIDFSTPASLERWNGRWLANVEKQLAATEGIYFSEKVL